ncbi:hypothetical protein ACQR1H_03020 [Bradyrhizobium sp. HKCCYLRH2015]|uniref:hypothetical protein n=1 Tax=Bradyrhizobium sp. HKCCYLRH2015 TaxID=3420742 RepID=UPI003EB7E470
MRPTKEPIAQVVNRISQLPLAKRRQALIEAMQREKGVFRRNQLTAVLQDLTARVIRQEMRRRST